MPPAVRMTNLGIRQVSQDVIEAAKSFGCTNRQRLFMVEMPLARPTIMAGLNQTIMLALIDGSYSFNDWCRGTWAKSS